MGPTITDPLVGRLVDGRYEVVSRIARGGMATVYLAIDRRLDREVALKVMHPHLAEGTSGSAFVARFRREARASARLTHPALVGVLDQGVDGETSYLTMEYVDGVNLRRHLGARGALSVEESFTILERVLDGLSAAHRTGLVHRDIKPENVLLATDGRIKLTDFGLARAVTEITSTTTGTVFGTVAYLGPELVAKGVSDARTDVYAAGIMLYEMLTGRQPHTGATPIQVAFLHVNSDIPAPSDLVSWLPQEVDDLVLALAARDPDDRPIDAGAALELVRRTHAELDDRTLARRADVAPTLEPPAARAAVGAISAGSLSAGSPESGLAAATRSDDPEDDLDRDSGATTRLDVASTDHTISLPIGAGVRTAAEASAAEHATTAPARRRRRLRWAAILLLVAAAVAAGSWWFLQWGPGAYANVPDVVGSSQEAATAVLADRGLDATAVPVFDQAQLGTVVATEPMPDAQIRKDGTVELTVSQGPEMTAMPADLVTMSFDDASQRLVDARLTVGQSVSEHSDTAPAGAVMAASAEPGTSLEVGAEVILTVSQGPAPLTVSSVVGATQEQATEDLEGQGLKVAATPAFSDTVEKGHVISQDPAPNAAGRRLDTVTLVVSQGPELIPLPNFFGQNVKNAQATLEAAGFIVEVRTPRGISLLNIVYSQSPGGGAEKSAPKGSTIILNIT